MDKYEIGTRLRGYPKEYLKDLALESHKIVLRDPEGDTVPHLTFLRPFYTSNEEKLINKFEKILSSYTEPILLKLNGFGIFDNEKKVIYGNLQKNEKINQMITTLEKGLEGLIKFKDKKIQLPEEKNRINLHSTIIRNLSEKEYIKVKNFIDIQKFDPITQPLFRTYLLKNNHILREFDFYLNENLERVDAKKALLFRKTAREFENKTGLCLSYDFTVRNNYST